MVKLLKIFVYYSLCSKIQVVLYALHFASIWNFNVGNLSINNMFKLVNRFIDYTL
jgi:hypothetical protein